MLCANTNRRTAVLVHHGGFIESGAAFVVTLGLWSPSSVRTALTDNRLPGHGSGNADVPGRGHRRLVHHGGDEGGRGAKGWTAQAWELLARQGVQITADVAAEGGAGYGMRGNRGSIFEGLAARAVRPDDALVVFYGSAMIRVSTPRVLRRGPRRPERGPPRGAAAPLLVIGPPWPTADVPASVTMIRDVLAADARTVGATFVDPIAERWFVGRPELIGKDGVHPTDAGHAYMADKIAPLIRAQLPKKA